MANHQGYMSPYMTNSLAIRQEIQRFESVHPSIYAIYDLIELVPDPLLAQQIREHVVCIEGRTNFRFVAQHTTQDIAAPKITAAKKLLIIRSRQFACRRWSRRDIIIDPFLSCQKIELLSHDII